MARRQGWSGTFRRDSKLQQYFLDRVVPTGKTLGTGFYGSVLEVSGVFNFPSIIQCEIVLLMQYCDRGDQSMKLSTVFVEGIYSNIRRGAIQIYIPLQKYFLQETLVNIIGETQKKFYLAPNTIIMVKINKRRYYRQLDYLIELANLIASQV